ncbi:hypothetical protein [Streptomyces sp. NPDC006446]|uniref:hypothetical protein n=1 Tax=Streptomyces sp. NPDC006446 TaxID=3154301 RepID=UPI0033A6BBF5
MAAAAGVSAATVCYILNEVEGKRVDTGTRQCVWEAARLPCAASAAAAVLSFRFVPRSPLRSRERNQPCSVRSTRRVADPACPDPRRQRSAAMG